VIDALRLVRLPYHLSAFTQAAAEGALAHSRTMLSTVDDIRAQRDRIVADLQSMGLDAYRSDANFVLFGGLADPSAIWQQLLDRGVLIRNVGLEGTLRVSAGTEAETSAFLAAMREVLAH
jgi:histidinol-phosphate aminotransferase